MSLEPNNVVRLIPKATGLGVDGDLVRLQGMLATAKQVYLVRAAAFDRSQIKDGRPDPGLRTHALLDQIDKLQSGITALTDALKAQRAHG